MFLVRCKNCGEIGWSEHGLDLDAAVRCDTPPGNPPGSVGGSCATNGLSHEDHVGYVRLTGDATARPVHVIAPPSSAFLRAVGGGA
jgi:hypothetical protein